MVDIPTIYVKVTGRDKQKVITYEFSNIGSLVYNKYGNFIILNYFDWFKF